MTKNAKNYRAGMGQKHEEDKDGREGKQLNTVFLTMQGESKKLLGTVTNEGLLLLRSCIPRFLTHPHLPAPSSCPPAMQFAETIQHRLCDFAG